jgi:hypothetical protein
MQSFLLLKQQPSGYYVHNDVFRYIDREAEAGVSTPAPTLEPVMNNVTTTSPMNGRF